MDEMEEFIETWEPYFTALETKRQENLDYFDRHWRIRASRYKPWRKNFWLYWFSKDKGYQWSDEELMQMKFPLPEDVPPFKTIDKAI